MSILLQEAEACFGVFLNVPAAFELHNNTFVKFWPLWRLNVVASSQYNNKRNNFFLEAGII